MGKRRDESDEPTLELPSLFRRRRREPDKETASEAAAEPVVEPAPEAESSPVAAEPVADRPVAAEPVAARAFTAEPEPAPAAAPDEPASEPESEPVSDIPEPAPAPGGRRVARPRSTGHPRWRPSAGAATLLAGGLVGLAGTGLTWLALQGCEALRGTDSCGGPGLLVLVAILTLMVVVGALVLKALDVTEPKATSFLGVGLMTVIVLVTLMESLFSAWMFLAVPVLTALSYLAAQWVSTRFVDIEEPSPGVDIR